jgi:hypothetical protein
MKIGIYFGDNDFWRTITKFLEILEEGVDNHHAYNITVEKRYTKEHIVKAFNEIASGIYWLSQNGFTYQTDWDAKPYLQLDISNVYIDAEVDEQLKEDNNGEFHFIEIKDKL